LAEWLTWLENTGIARMVQESLWGYPIVLSSHAVGMAVLAGIVLVFNFRVLGMASAIPISALKTMYRFALIGLVINTISGLMLFVSNADAFWVSTPFWIKLGLLTVGLTLMVKMSRQMFDPGETYDDFNASKKLKTMALVSSVAWFGVIIAGRLIAYIDWKEF
jgi:hypothetical protein